MKIALVLCPIIDVVPPHLGVAPIYAYLKNDYEIKFLNFNIDFYNNPNIIEYPRNGLISEEKSPNSSV